MLALVDDVPRTLTLDQFISQLDRPPDRRHPAPHPLPAAPRPRSSAHIYRGLVKALDALDDVIALIRRSQTTDEAREGLMTLLEIDEVQARAILDMQLRRLAALERQKIIDGWPSSRRSSPTSRRSWPARSGSGRSSATSCTTIVDKYGDERRSQIIPADGDLSMEDLIPDEDLVVTITRGGYAKRTRADLYRTAEARRQGRARCHAARATTWSSTSSPPPTTTGCCSSPPPAGSTAPRPTTCPRPRATPRAVTWPACCPSSPTSRSRRCWRSATTSRRPTSCWRPATAW